MATPQEVYEGLLGRGVPPHIAQGVVANFQDESGLDTGIEEKSPTVKGSRGGFGLAQWTGPRRRALEAFAQERGDPVSDLDVQLDFFMHENTGAERAAWQKVLAAKTPQEAAVNFVTHWERPAPEHRARRAARYQQEGGVALLSADPFVPAPPKPLIPSLEIGLKPSARAPRSQEPPLRSLLSSLRMRLARLFQSK